MSGCKGLGMNHYCKEWFEICSEVENVLFIKTMYAKSQPNIMSIVLGVLEKKSKGWYLNHLNYLLSFS